MFTIRRLTLIATLTAAVSLGVTGDVRAGWVTIKNDTGKPIILQDVVVVNGQTRWGKPTNLLAGDTVREFLPVATVKQIDIFDPQNPQLPIGTAKLNCMDDAQAYTVALSGGKLTVTPVPKK